MGDERPDETCETDEADEVCNIAREVLLARRISMIMPLQSQQILISGPQFLAWSPAAVLRALTEAFLLGRFTDWER